MSARRVTKTTPDAASTSSFPAWEMRTVGKWAGIFGTSVESYQYTGLSPTVVDILMRRGISAEAAKIYLNPTRENSYLSPYGIRRMDKAVRYITQAMEKGEKIAVLGDYDVDGCTGTAILQRFFKAVGVEVETYIPHRANEGYGPNSDAIRKLHKKGVKLLITVDCGTTSYESLQLAKELGMKVIVTDHHKPDKGTQYPDGAEIVNPNRKDSKQPAEIAKKYQVMTGAGVAYLLAEGLYESLDEKKWFKMHPKPEHHTLFEPLHVLAAFGTYCDVAPLTGINRWLVKEGLAIMNRWRTDKNAGNITHWPIIGLEKLVDVAQLSKTELTEQDLGFQLGPRINAVGRIDHAIHAKNLLSTDNAEEANALACRADADNIKRKEIQKVIYAQAELQAEQQKNDDIIFVYGKGWHEGVIGIVAGGLKEKYGKPTFVITIDEHKKAKGSARSIEGVDIGDAVISALHGDAKLLKKGGGHGMAAGFSLEEKKLDPFHRYLTSTLGRDVKRAIGKRTLPIDAVVNVGDITPTLARDIAKLAPFGRGNEPPRLAIKNCKVLEPKIIGASQNTLTATLYDAADKTKRANAIMFKNNFDDLAPVFQHPKELEPLQVAGAVSWNMYQGQPKLQIQVDDAFNGPISVIMPEKKLKIARINSQPSERTR